MTKQKHFPFVRLQGDAKIIYHMLRKLLMENATPTESELLERWYGASCLHAPSKSEDTLDVGVVCYARNRWRIVDNEVLGGHVVCQFFMGTEIN